MSKFIAKEAYFERKSQIAPNALVFHREMSDSSKLLILALNGIATCSPGWTPIQEDLRNRLGWGRDKMQAAIKGAIKYGYLKVTQSRKTNEHGVNQKGKFSHNDFEHDIDGGYLKTKNSTVPEKPLTCFTAPTKPTLPNKEDLTYKKEDIYIKKQQQDTSHLPDVVVSLDRKKEDVQEDSESKSKMEILAHYGLTTQFLVKACTFSLEDIKNAAMATEQQKQRVAKKGSFIESESGMFRRALEQKWKPSKPHRTKFELDKIQQNNVKLAKDCKKYFKEEKNEIAPIDFDNQCDCYVTCLYLHTYNEQAVRSSIKLDIHDENFEDILLHFLQIKRNR